MKVRLILTYIAIILICVSAISVYMLSAMEKALYDDDKVSMMTEINIIATDISSVSEADIEAALSEDIARLSIAKDKRIIITNKDAVVIYDNTVNIYADSVGKVRISPMILSALSGESTYTKVETDGEMTTAASAPIILDSKVSGVVYMESPADEIELLLSTTYKRVLYLAIFMCAIVILLSVIFAGVFTSPIEKLIKKIKERGEKKSEIDIVAQGEIGELVDSFNALLKELDELEEKRSAFVSNASHELKTPLSSIKLICDSIISAGENAPREMVNEFLGDMNEEVDRLTNIINDLLDLTRMDAIINDDKKQFVTANLNDVVGGVVSSLLKIAMKNGVELKYHGNSDIFMLMERNKIWEAVYNITDNAIKYTPYGGKVEVYLEKDVNDAIITIRDTGIGIAPGDIKNIFDRFYRVDKARSRETGGTGLGLSIALTAVEMHGGHINVESEEGEGSVFRIYLPVA